ncbi:MAG: hypothetical protein L0G89_01060 [Janibacter sp.]|nr:hypothetical protein [Janibacter sp.]
MTMAAVGRHRVLDAPRLTVPALVAVLQGALILGPALGRGVVVAYDMPWSPDPRWTPFVLGLGTPAPRAVPSDAAAVLLGKVVGASLAQDLVLLAILTGLGVGAAKLMGELWPQARTTALVAVSVAAVWNPYVHERLAAGQWVVVLGLAVLPWGLSGTLRALHGRAGLKAVALPVAVASLGGINALFIVMLSVFTMALTAVAARRDRHSLRVAGASLAVAAGGSAAWGLPGLMTGAAVDPAGVSVFGPVADTPLGVLGSLVSGGGFWNVATHPVTRNVPLLAVVAAVVATTALVAFTLASRRFLGPRQAAPLLMAVALPTGFVLLSALPETSGLWTAAVTGLPGGGALRDSQKFMAAWVLAIALGLGVLVQWTAERATRDVAVPACALLVGLPIALSATLGWGVAGQLDAMSVAPGYRTAVSKFAALPPGDVGLLPWSQYRRYDWNDSRVSLTLAPRMIDRVVVFDDSLPLRAGTIGGESERARAVSEALLAGVAPQDALREVGVRYVAAELRAGELVDESALRASGHVVVDDTRLLIVDIGGPEHDPAISATALIGWTVTLITVLGVFSGAAAGPVRRMAAALLKSLP